MRDRQVDAAANPWQANFEAHIALNRFIESVQNHIDRGTDPDIVLQQAVKVWFADGIETPSETLLATMLADRGVNVTRILRNG